jgi:hypothetical protein
MEVCAIQKELCILKARYARDRLLHMGRLSHASRGESYE